MRLCLLIESRVSQCLHQQKASGEETSSKASIGGRSQIWGTMLERTLESDSLSDNEQAIEDWGNSWDIGSRRVRVLSITSSYLKNGTILIIVSPQLSKTVDNRPLQGCEEEGR